MNEERDDAIEALLRRQFHGPVADEGFSARIVQRLPRRRRRAAWPLGAGLLAGVAACWAVLRSSPLLVAGWHDYAGGHWSTAAIAVSAAMLGMTLLALAWSVAEADDA